MTNDEEFQEFHDVIYDRMKDLNNHRCSECQAYIRRSNNENNVLNGELVRAVFVLLFVYSCWITFQTFIKLFM